MRKRIWCCFAGAGAIVAAVIGLACYAVYEPQSVLGQMMIRGGQLTFALHLRQQSASVTTTVGPRPVEIAEDPTELSEPAPIVETTGTPIVIPEDDSVPAAAMPIQADANCPVQHAELFPPPGIECPTSDLPQIAPARMPYCEEEPRTHKARKPRESLPMPSVEEDSEEQEQPALPTTGGANKLMRLFDKLLKKDAPVEGSKNAVQKLRRYQTRFEMPLLPRDVDTMEYRASDRKLFEYGCGPF